MKTSSITEVWTAEILKDTVDRFNTSDYDWNLLQGRLNQLPKAAVLVPVVIVEGKLHVWLTKRSSRVGHDKGHVSFPGGMKDPSDSNAVTTALREADEEIGLLPEHIISVLGRLPPRINLRQYLVTPVVALVSPTFIPSPNEEVEFAFRLPLDEFLSADDHWSSHVGDGSPLAASLIHFFRYIDPQGREAITFGFTASMCITIACALIGREPEFEYASANKIDPSDPFRAAVDYLEYYSAGKAEDFFRQIKERGEVPISNTEERRIISKI